MCGFLSNARYHLPYPDQEMEMIRKQTIGIGFNMLTEKFCIFL